VEVYPSRTGTWLTLATFAVLTAGFLVWGVAAVRNGPHLRDLFVIAGLFLWPAGVSATVRQLREPRPAARLDGEGVESDFGFEPWSNITQVEARWRITAHTADRRLVLHLRVPDPQPRPPSREYASSLVRGRSVVYDDRIEVPLWASKSRVLADIRRASASYGLAS
jgi:hypothetical protein